MKSAWCMAAAAAAFLFSTPVASFGQDPPTPAEPLDTPILLRLAPPEGRVSRYAHSTQAEVESPMMPSSPVMTMRTYQTQAVVGVADGAIRLRTTIDSTSTAMPVPGMEMPDFSGITITTEMDTRGRVLGVIDTDGMPAIAGFNPEDLLQQSSSFVLPEEEVSPGDSWTQDVPMELPMGPGGSMSMGIVTTYTFVGLDGSLATLSFEGPIEMEMEMEVAGGGMTATGTMSGTMVVDLAEGRFRSQSTRASFDMNMAGMTMETNVTTTMELLPDP